MTNLNGFICAGYILVKSVPRSEWHSADLLPEHILSLSAECIVPSVAVYWGWHENGQAEAVLFGIPESKLADLSDWMKQTDTVHFPNIFLTVAAAREFAAKFLAGIEDVHLLGIGLPSKFVEAFLQGHSQRTYNPNEDKYSYEEYGTNAVLRNGEPLSPGGQALGFEVLSYSYALGHSWLCNYLERDMHQLFGIRPNARGFIDTLEEAMQVYEWIAEDEQQGHRAEPEPYYPWLVTEYPLQATTAGNAWGDGV